MPSPESPVRRRLKVNRRRIHVHVIFNGTIGARRRHHGSERGGQGTGGNARLYALGHDAFKLSQQITLLSNTPQMGLQGLTGELYLSGQNYISRQLRWATFQQGVPQLMKGHVA